MTTSHICAHSPHCRVGLFSGKTGAIVRGISRFHTVAHSGVMRGDGKLVGAGQDNGVVQLFDSTTKDVLRVFKGHVGPVQTVRFGADNVHVATGGDDRSTRLWDLPSGAQVASYSDHTDYVRALDTSPASPHVWMTGSYDHTVKLWDARSAEGCTMTMDHGAPVTSVLLLRGGMTAVTAGGTYLKVWDLMAGGKAVTKVQAHQKLITTLCLDGSGDRVLSGSLDHCVNVYNNSTWDVAYTIKHEAPILSVGVSPSNTQLVVGDTAHNLTVRTRQVSTDSAVHEQSQLKVIRGGSYKYFMRGQGATPAADDSQAAQMGKPNLAAYDKLLKKFKYSDALDSALGTGNPVVVTSLLQELTARDGLRSAMAGRTEDDLQPVLAFLVRYLAHPRYSSTLCDTAELMLQQYGATVGTSPRCDALWLRLGAAVRSEVALQQELLRLQGSLDSLIAASSTALTAGQTAARRDAGATDGWMTASRDAAASGGGSSGDEGGQMHVHAVGANDADDNSDAWGEDLGGGSDDSDQEFATAGAVATKRAKAAEAAEEAAAAFKAAKTARRSSKGGHRGSKRRGSGEQGTPGRGGGKRSRR